MDSRWAHGECALAGAVILRRLTIAGLLDAQTKKEGDPAGPQNFTKDVAVPMRDGVVLRADVWLPGSDG